MAATLNLNNEVVKMRKEIKKIRALVIRKLTRQISNLRNKKGSESEVEKNQRKVARLMEEIKQMKTLKPDYVTKKALQSNLNFEKVCKDPECTLLDRATARIASHPQISKKIEELKAAVKAFNEERAKTQSSGKPEKNTGEEIIKQNSLSGESDKANLCDTRTQNQDQTEKPADSTRSVRDETSSQVQGPSYLESRKTRVQMEGNLSSPKQKPAISSTPKVSQTVPKKGKEVPVKTQLTPENTSFSAVEGMKEPEDEESDLEQSDEEKEKEYFDDSTEERFHMQSSQSEDSDDDFFLGKASKHKKKMTEESGSCLKNPFSSAAELVAEARGAGGGEGKSKQGSKPAKLETMFCNSLSGLRQVSSRGAQGASKFKIQQSRRGPAGNRKLIPSTKQQGRGRLQVEKPQGRTAPAEKGLGPSQNAQQALHPSWEASKRRKEQQAQIMAFQGKKIKFDED